MSKYLRASLIFACGLTAMAVLSFIIPQFNLAQMDKNTALTFFLVAGLSLALIVTSFMLKDHFNLGLFMVSYMLSAAAGIGLLYYQITESGQDYDLIPLLILILSVAAANVICELYLRKKLHLIAEGCMSGRRLLDYTRRPWMYLDEKSKKTLFILYFDVPELARWALSRQTSQIKKIEDQILELVFKKIGEHDGILIRKSEDSFIAVFELPERLEIKSFKSTDRYTAYHSILCALELKNTIDDLKDITGEEFTKNLKGRSIIVKDSGTILKHIRSGRMELSLFSDAMNKVADIMPLSSGEDIICTAQVHELCSSYFRTKKRAKDNYEVLGLSAHIEDGL